MKVLYISHSAKLYGAPKSLLEFVRNMKEKGIEPIVIMPSQGELQKELNNNKIANLVIPYYQCVYHGEYHAIDYVKYVWTNLKAVVRIRKLIKKERIEIVHTNTLAVDVGAIAVYLLKIPHIWHFREYLKEDFDYKLMNKGLVRKLVQKSKRCIAISEGIKRKYQKEYGILPVRLYDGIQKIRESCKENGNKMAEYQVHSSEIMVVFYGLLMLKNLADKQGNAQDELKNTQDSTQDELKNTQDNTQDKLKIPRI